MDSLVSCFRDFFAQRAEQDAAFLSQLQTCISTQVAEQIQQQLPALVGQHLQALSPAPGQGSRPRAASVSVGSGQEGPLLLLEAPPAQPFQGDSACEPDGVSQRKHAEAQAELQHTPAELRGLELDLSADRPPAPAHDTPGAQELQGSQANASATTLPDSSSEPAENMNFYMWKCRGRRVTTPLPFTTDNEDILCGVLGPDSDAEEVDLPKRWFNRLQNRAAVRRRRRCFQRLWHHTDASRREVEMEELNTIDHPQFFVHVGAAGDSDSSDAASEIDEGLPLYGEHEMDAVSDDEEAGAAAEDQPVGSRAQRLPPGDLLSDSDDEGEQDLLPQDATRLQAIALLHSQRHLQKACNAAVAAAGSSRTPDQRSNVVGSALSSQILAASPAMQTPEAQARLAAVMSLVTAELDGYEAQWREVRLPKLQAQAFRIWRRGQQARVRDDWRFTLQRCQERLQEWVLEIGLMHVDSKAISEASIRLGCRNLRVTKEDQLLPDFKLALAAGAEPEAPATPAQPAHRQQDAARAGGGESDADEQSDSFMATSDDDDKDEPPQASGPPRHTSAGSKRPRGDADANVLQAKRGRAAAYPPEAAGEPSRGSSSAGLGDAAEPNGSDAPEPEVDSLQIELTDVDSQADGERSKDEQEPAAKASATPWNAAQLKPLQTEVLVAPGQAPPSAASPHAAAAAADAPAAQPDADMPDKSAAPADQPVEPDDDQDADGKPEAAEQQANPHAGQGNLQPDAGLHEDGSGEEAGRSNGSAASMSCDDEPGAADNQPAAAGSPAAGEPPLQAASEHEQAQEAQEGATDSQPASVSRRLAFDDAPEAPADQPAEAFPPEAGLAAASQAAAAAVAAAAAAAEAAAQDHRLTRLGQARFQPGQLVEHRIQAPWGVSWVQTAVESVMESGELKIQHQEGQVILVQAAEVRPFPESCLSLPEAGSLERGQLVDVLVKGIKGCVAVRALVLCHLPWRASHEHTNAARPFVDDAGLLSLADLCASASHSKTAGLLLHYGGTSRVFHNARIADGHLRMPCDWHPDQQRWTPASAAEQEELQTLIGIGSRADEAGSVANKRRDKHVKGQLQEWIEAGKTVEEVARSFNRKYLARRPGSAWTACKRLTGLLPPRPKRGVFNIPDALPVRDPDADPVKPRSPAVWHPGDLFADIEAASHSEAASVQTGARKKADPSLKGAKAAAATRKRNMDKRRDEQQATLLAQAAAKQRQRQQQREQHLASPQRLQVHHQRGTYPLFEGQQPEHRGQVMIAPSMGHALKQHQWEGLRFLWENIYENFQVHSNDDDETDASGALLAHCMGLGKSMQVIAFLHALGELPEGGAAPVEHGGRTLLVAPTNTLANWQEEFASWLPPPPRNAADNPRRLTVDKVIRYNKVDDVRKWHALEGSVLIISYEKLVADLKDKTDRAKKKAKKQADKQAKKACLSASLSESNALAQAPANTLALPKAPSAAVSTEEATVPEEVDEDPAAVERRELQAMLRFSPSIVVADEGHRMKNDEGFFSQCMELVETRRRIVLTGYPLQNHLQEYYVMLKYVDPGAWEDAEVFRDLFSAPVEAGQCADASSEDKRNMGKALYRLNQITTNILDRKGEDILQRLLPPKRELIVHLRLTAAQERLVQAYLQVGSGCRALFSDWKALNMACDVPAALVERLLQQATWREEAPATADEDLLGLPTAAEDAGQKPAARRKERGDAVQRGVALAVLQQVADCLEQLQQLSPKFLVVRQLVRHCASAGEKLVIFSENIKTLDALQEMLQRDFNYCLNVQYFRVQGGVSADKRKTHIDDFNKSSLSKVFLGTTKAAGIGINLVSARRAVIMDEPMNPSHNKQAAARVWRMGQPQEVFVHRLVYSGTMGGVTYKRAVDKESLFKRAIDSKTVKGMNSLEDLEWYSFEHHDPADPSAVRAAAQKHAGDAGLQHMVESDMTQGRYILGITDHKENLMEDPTQELTDQDRQEALQEVIAIDDDLEAAGPERKPKPSVWTSRLRKRASATAATLRAVMPAELEDGTQLPASLPLPPHPASFAPAHAHTAQAAVQHTVPPGDSTPLQPAKRQQQSHGAATSGGQPLLLHDGIPADEPAGPGCDMDGLRGSHVQQQAAGAPREPPAPPVSAPQAPDAKMQDAPKRSSPVRQEGPASLDRDAHGLACQPLQAAQQHQQQDQLQQRKAHTVHPGRPHGQGSPSDSSSDGTHEGAFPALHPAGNAPRSGPHPSAEPPAPQTGARDQPSQLTARLLLSADHKRARSPAEGAQNPAGDLQCPASAACAPAPAIIIISDSGVSGQPAPRPKAVVPKAEGGAPRGTKRASARISSSSSAGMTQEEKALRRKAKQATGHSPIMNQRAQRRRHSDAGGQLSAVASCKEEADNAAPVSRAGSAAPRSVSAKVPKDQQDEVTSPMRKRGLPEPISSPILCSSPPVIVVSDSEEERERMSQEA